MRTVLGLSAAVALAGCAHDRVPRRGETISYTTSPCYGTCPAFTVTLGPDGQGIFVGQQSTAVAGERRFEASPEQVRAFTEKLAPFRPKGEELIEPEATGKGRSRCREAATDQSSVDIQWHPAAAPASHLRFYYGCDVAKNRAMAAALLGAPDLLPIADLIGKH